MLTTFALVLLTVQVTSSSDPMPLRLTDSRFQYSFQKAANKPQEQLLLIRKGKQIVQRIPLTGPAAQQPETEIVLKDVNFDKQLDLMITSGRGIVNSTYSFWLYDKPTNRFVLNPVLSNQVGGYEVKIDSAKQEITTASRNGCCEHEWSTYRFAGNQLKLVQTKKTK